MPAKEQVAAVNARLQTLNPKYDSAALAYTIHNDIVDSLVLNSAQLTNITPLHVLKDLRELTIVAPNGQGGLPRGGVADLRPLRGMMKLDRLYMDNISVAEPRADCQAAAYVPHDMGIRRPRSPASSRHEIEVFELWDEQSRRSYAVARHALGISLLEHLRSV